ncbi:OmpA family protein [Paraburkholderia solisilvae]|uniref:Outer membrane protein A n=1 Tax=Paraburkholderia solisilvae TaxID=624376 RepID=A0A6J5EKW3_9BURK|nr:OmpA family protein [Paraburkholderia solisilvae]CAB3767180.1 Outer membrane protein A [Paraburkholderia solisilvae]
MKQLCIVAAVLAACSGCAGQAAREQLDIRDPSVAHGGFGTPQDAPAGAALSAWTDVYTPIKRRGATLEALQKRLDRLGSKQLSYDGAKAQCWIDTGKQAFAARDEWGFVEESIGEATRLISGLESGHESDRKSGLESDLESGRESGRESGLESGLESGHKSRSQPVPASGNARTVGGRTLRTSVPVRPDLWAQLAALKADTRFASCPPAQKLTACAEVELTRAGHDAWTRAFTTAQQRADALQAPLRDATQALAACKAPLASVSAPAPEVIALSADALFAFGRGDLAAISDEGRQQLDRVAARLRALDTIERLVVAGYTDRLGSADYNLRLSRERADTVRRYLAGRGVSVPIDARGFGKAQPGSACSMRNREALIACLAPDRRVEIRVTGAQLNAQQKQQKQQKQ